MSNNEIDREPQAEADEASVNSSLAVADEIIKDIASTDYSAGRAEIARVIRDDIWNGNWDSQTDFEAIGLSLPDLRIIEENEYDQSMDDDEKPDWDTMLTDCSAGYVFPA